MAMTNYISELLYRYECVVLPGFGAFITHRQPARIQLEDNLFYPPQKSISFNQQLSKNDGLLANHVAEIEKIPYSGAVEKIDHFVTELKAVLENQRPLKLEKIGSFTLTEEGKLQFEPAAEMNYLKESFGLDSFQSSEILRESYKQRVVALEEKAPIAFTPERRKSRPYLKYAAIGLLAIGLSGFTGLNIYSSQVKEHNLAEQQKAASALENQIQKATFAIENPLPAITFKVAKQEGNYHIVAGAFREEENAQKKVEQLRKEGFLARKMEVNRYGLHQVLYSSYESRRDAINALYKIQRTSNPGAWLLVKEI